MKKYNAIKILSGKATIEINKPEYTPEGFLITDIILASEGVLDYPEFETKELLGNAIHDPDFLKTWDGAPFTEEHPEIEPNKRGFVDPKNYQKFIKGVVIDPVSYPDAGKVKARLKVFDKEIIDKIINKELVELSIGYSSLENGPAGTYNGQDYDIEQRKLVGNHLAITQAGRAGMASRILYNSIEEENTTGVKMEEKLDKLIELQMQILEMLKPSEPGPEPTPEGPREDEEPVLNQEPSGDGMTDEEKKKKEEEAKKEIMNSAVNMANQISDAKMRTVSESMSILGADALAAFSRFNSVEDFQKHAIVKSGFMDDSEISSLKGPLQVQQAFSAAVRFAQKTANMPRLNSLYDSEENVSYEEL